MNAIPITRTEQTLAALEAGPRIEVYVAGKWREARVIGTQARDCMWHVRARVGGVTGIDVFTPLSNEGRTWRWPCNVEVK